MMLIESLLEAAAVLTPPSKIIKLGTVEVELKEASTEDLSGVVAVLGKTLSEALVSPEKFTGSTFYAEVLSLISALEPSTVDRLVCVILKQEYKPGQSLPPYFVAEIVKGWLDVNGESLKKTLAVFSLVPEKAVASSSRGRRSPATTP